MTYLYGPVWGVFIILYILKSVAYLISYLVLYGVLFCFPDFPACNKIWRYGKQDSIAPYFIAYILDFTVQTAYHSGPRSLQGRIPVTSPDCGKALLWGHPG